MPELDGAVADIGLDVAENSEETVETTTETGDIGTTTDETSNQVDSQEQKQGLTEKTANKGKVDLAKVAKVSAEALKAIDPTLPAAMQKAAYELGSLYREFQGGLKEAVALKNSVSEFGGVEGMKETAAALAEIQPALKAFFDGKPEFIDALIKESPTAFAQIMPTGLEKWKQADPEMYNHVQARVMMQTLDGARVSDTLSALWNATKEPETKDAIANIWNLLDGFRQAGAKAPERKVNPEAEALTKREQALAERETKALLAPVANEGRQQIQTITEREMTSSYKWAETDPSVKDAVQDRVRTEVIEASKKDKTFLREFERLKERGDAQGLSRHVKNFQERVTPGIVQRVAKLFAVKPKGAGPQVAKKPPVITGNGNGAKVDVGWQRVSAQPPASQMDRSKTTDDMIMSNRMIHKDGRKLQWA